jgi:AcrR family transcriptional regulator
MAIEPLTPERRRQQTREHLLRAAARVFADRGYHGASLDEVATVAGFTKGAVYSNFKNKEDLFLALFKENYDREMDALEETLETSSGDPQSRLAHFVAFTRADAPAGDPNVGLLYQEFCLYAARNPSARKRLTEISDEAVHTLAEIITAERVRLGIEPLASPDLSARFVEILFRGIGLLRLLQPELVDDDFVESAIAFVARGLQAPLEADG